jgi:L-alanine-DL-glutamate epimerase-like enolase superfamily enzyme
VSGTRRLTVRHDTFPLAGVFRISRGARSEANVVVAEIAEGPSRGRGECLPYPRYGETVEGVMAQVASLADAVAEGLDRAALQEALPPGAARNAVDCALWDLEAKQTGRPAWELAGVPEPQPLDITYTISLGTPDEMAAQTREHADAPLLKLKLTGEGDLARVQAVRKASPQARIITDANEGWTAALYRELAPSLARLGVELIEQPLPADSDEPLADMEHPVPVCADESCHVAADVPALATRYDFVNVKLDKSGGLTEALRVVEAARDAGLGIMVGCMVGTSLGVAPATLLGYAVRYADLDAPLLIAQDRPDALAVEGSVLHPPRAALWG